MAGSKAGGKKAAKKNLEQYGKDFYRMIGSKGGRNGHTGGFAAHPELAKIAGAKGGRRSTRLGILNGQGKNNEKEYFWKGEDGDALVFKKKENI